MGNGSDGLHLNCIHLLQRMVEDSGSVDGLETEVLVVEVTDEQTLRRECVRLHINIRSGNALQEAGLSNIGIAANQQRSRVRVDGGQTTQMLADLVKVQEGVFKPAANGGHASQRGTLELLALEERLGVFQQANVISRHDLDQMLCGRQLSKGDAEMVGIVEGVQEILVERMDVLEAWEAIKNERDLLCEGFLRELDLTRVEI